MASGFNIYRIGEEGPLHVTWRPDIKTAEEFVRELIELFPGEYRIEEDSASETHG